MGISILACMIITTPKSNIRRAFALLLAVAFSLSTWVITSSGACAVTNTSMASSMPCCMAHETTGINAPCHCRARPVPLRLTNNAVSTTNFIPRENAQPVEIGTIKCCTDKGETINVRWLACDSLLRAPPVRLYIINCALLN